jgi:hypothetical protein
MLFLLKIEIARLPPGYGGEASLNIIADVHKKVKCGLVKTPHLR